MPIVCTITSGAGGAPDPAVDVATALAARTGLGPVRRVALDEAAAGGGDLLIAAGPPGDPAVARLGHDAVVPLLIVRDPAPLLAWAAGQTVLRAVLGWDRTATTAAAVEPLVALRRAGAIDVAVVHVYFPDETARRFGLRVASVVDRSPALEALLRRDIEHELGALGGVGAVTIAPSHGLGHIGDHLIARAESESAQLLVVGNHHRGGLRRLSSVAARVLADASASVLLVPLRPDAALDVGPGFRTAVAATDGTAFGNRAIPYAYRLVPERGEVHLVRVVAAGEPADDRQLIEGLLRLSPSGRPDTRTVAHVVRDDDPAHAIAIAAERIGADVVCIASHGRAGLLRALVGSVTDRLLHVCRRPVLVLHPVE